MQRMIHACILCFAMFASVGCKPDHRYIYEKFEVHKLDIQSSEMSCDISLRGKEQSAGQDEDTGMSLSYLRSPYTVLISFRFPKELSGVIELKEILFIEDDKLIKSVEVKQQKKFDNKTEYRKGGVSHTREEGESRASFLVRDIRIPHSKQKVLIKTVISSDDGNVQKTWEFKLLPIIEEELRNNQRDSILSV